jgi:thiol-disulfide isomerase/thioredoxin
MEVFKKFMQAVGLGKPVFLLVTSEPCAPCAEFAPVYEKYIDTASPEYTFAKMNIKELDANFVRTRSIRSAPTVLMFKFGLETGRASGDNLKYFEDLADNHIKEYLIDFEGEGDIECEACQ